MIWHSDQTCFEQMTINSESNMGNKSLCLEHNLLLGSRAMTWSGSNLFYNELSKIFNFPKRKINKNANNQTYPRSKEQMQGFFFLPHSPWFQSQQLILLTVGQKFSLWVKWNSNLRNCSELELMRDIMEM